MEAKAGVLRVLGSLLRDRGPGGSLRRSKPPEPERSGTWRRRRQPGGRPDLQRTPPGEAEGSCRANGVLKETCSEPPLPSSTSSERRTTLCSLTGELEARLQRLNFAEDEETKRSASLRRHPAGEALDFSNFLEKDFSVQSMTSMINEDCFYDSVLRSQRLRKLTG